MFNLSAIFLHQDIKNDRDNAFVVEEGAVNFDCLLKHEGYAYGFETMAKVSSGLIKGGGSVFRTACLFLEHDNMGIFKVGFTRTAADTFSVDSCGLLTAYNGFESQNFSIFYNESAGSTVDIGSQFLDDSRALKISWKSPVASGFSVGLSFTPDTRTCNPFRTLRKEQKCAKCDDKLISQFGMGKTYSKNVVSCGAAYEIGDPKALNAKVSVAGWFGQGKSGLGDVKVHNVCAYNVDLKIGYDSFNIAFGYTDNGKSLMARERASEDIGAFDPDRKYSPMDAFVGFRDGADAGKIYSARTAYSFKNLSLSAGYMKSIVKFSGSEKATGDVLSLGAEYKFHKALSLYVEYDHIKTDTCARAQAMKSASKGESGAPGKNKANLFIIGSKISI
jgi:predicted porin